MKDIDFKKLQETIAASFIRSNVLPIEEAKGHAALAVAHMRNALALSNLRKGDA